MDNYVIIKKKDYEALYDHLCRAITDWEQDPNGAVLYFAMVDLQNMFNNTETE